jgi:hypothetical protein
MEAWSYQSSLSSSYLYRCRSASIVSETLFASTVWYDAHNSGMSFKTTGLELAGEIGGPVVGTRHYGNTWTLLDHKASHNPTIVVYRYRFITVGIQMYGVAKLHGFVTGGNLSSLQLFPSTHKKKRMFMSSNLKPIQFLTTFVLSPITCLFYLVYSTVHFRSSPSLPFSCSVWKWLALSLPVLI